MNIKARFFDMRIISHTKLFILLYLLNFESYNVEKLFSGHFVIFSQIHYAIVWHPSFCKKFHFAHKTLSFADHESFAVQVMFGQAGF